jgi:hypothetical protein
VHAMSHRFSLLPSSLLLFTHCSRHHSTFHHTMTSENDQNSNATGDTAMSGAKSAAGAESETASVSSSSNVVIQTMAKKEVPKLFEYWKALTITEKDLSSYHATGWLTGVVLYSTTALDFPTIDRTIIVCFELHQMCGLGLPPSKFHVSILNNLGCELVHLHLNTISALSCFSMMCECWLGISPDTSLF